MESHYGFVCTREWCRCVCIRLAIRFITTTAQTEYSTATLRRSNATGTRAQIDESLCIVSPFTRIRIHSPSIFVVGYFKSSKVLTADSLHSLWCEQLTKGFKVQHIVFFDSTFCHQCLLIVCRNRFANGAEDVQGVLCLLNPTTRPRHHRCRQKKKQPLTPCTKTEESERRYDSPSKSATRRKIREREHTSQNERLNH